MPRLTSAALLCALLLAPGLPAAALPKPAHVSVSLAGPAPVIRWDEVEGAGVYRVAVFAAPDEEGKRALMAAVWVKGLSWPYGNGKVVPKAGKLPSTPAKPLAEGEDYKVMVSAAAEDGSSKSDWAAADFTAPGRANPPSYARAALTATPTPSPTAMAQLGTATPSPTPQSLDAKGSSGTAELEIDLAQDIKEQPEAGERGLSPTAEAPATLDSARALLQAGKSEDAEGAYRKLLDKDATNADYWEGLGDSYDARKMKVEAMEAYQKALAIDKRRERLRRWMDENVKR